LRERGRLKKAPPRRGSMLNDQNSLTPAAMAAQLNEGGPVRGPKDQLGNGPKPKPQFSPMASGKAS